LEIARRLLPEWQKKLRLEDWDIGIEQGDMSVPEHAAETTSEWRRKHATITYRPDFIEYVCANRDGVESDRWEVEATLVHELLHVMEAPLVGMVQAEIDWYVGKRNEDGGIIGAELRNQWRDYREYWINQVVRVLVPRGAE
jgi:hypothetical protein